MDSNALSSFLVSLANQGAISAAVVLASTLLLAGALVVWAKLS